MSILAYVIKAVDLGMSMPDGRRMLSVWVQTELKNDVTRQNEARTRLRRLKQIADAVNEEVMTTLGSMNV